MTLSANERWLAGGAAAVLAAAFVLAAIPSIGIDRAPQTSFCVSRLLLGRECPGCGLTRSFIAIARGRFDEAVALNPLGPVLFAWAALLLATRLIPLPHRRWADVTLTLSLACALLLRSAGFYA